MVAVKRSPGFDVLVERGVSNAARISVPAVTWSLTAAEFAAGIVCSPEVVFCGLAGGLGVVAFGLTGWFWPAGWPGPVLGVRLCWEFVCGEFFCVSSPVGEAGAVVEPLGAGAVWVCGVVEGLLLAPAGVWANAIATASSANSISAAALRIRRSFSDSKGEKPV